MAKFKVVLIGHGNTDNVTVDTDADAISRSAIAINAGRYYYFEGATFSSEPDSPHVLVFREAEVCTLDAAQ